MRRLHAGLVLGILAASAACSGGDPRSTTPPTASSSAVSEPSTVATTAVLATRPATTSTTDGAPVTTVTPTTLPGPLATTVPPRPNATDAPMLNDVKAYFLHGERLAIVHRRVPGPATLRGALTELLAGPEVQERAVGLHSEIPVNTELLDVAIADGLVTIDLSDEFDEGGGSLSMTARVAQLVFTATQFDTAEEVLFWMEGEQVELLGGEGLVLTEPLARKDIDRAFTGGILIDTPQPGSTVTSPLTIIGEGDVFEGDFPIVVRRDGRQIAGPFLGFAGAWGNWADFEVTFDIDADPGPIEVVAWDEQGCTPGDGECSAVVEVVVPLILTE